MSSADDNMTIRYSAKELFQQVNDKLDIVLLKLESKADHETVVKLTERIDVLEEKSSQTEAVATALLNSKKNRWTVREKVLGLLFAGVTTMLNLAAIYAAFISN